MQLKEQNFTKLYVTKSVLTVNGSFPGPEIRVHKGDTVFDNVHNNGYYGVTLHCHGVKQPQNPWSDNPEYITQCPIAPGTNFTYKIQFTNEEGILWWHAHSSWTRATVHNAKVILPGKGTTYPYPKPNGEEVLVFETTYRMLIDYGKTYLLRMINAFLKVDLFFSIAGHNLTVFGMDRAYLKPIDTTYIMLTPGQTMDVLVTANQSVGYYYMTLQQYSSDGLDVTNYDHSNTTAILQYRGNYSAPKKIPFPSTLPSYKDNVVAMTFTDRLRSLGTEEHPVNVPQNVTTRMLVLASMGVLICPNSSCGGIYGDRMAANLNNYSWVNPSIDILQAYYRNVSDIYSLNFPDFPGILYNFTGDDLPLNIPVPIKGSVVKVFDFNETIEIVFQGTNIISAAEAHPMHLHGYAFYVVGTGIRHCDVAADPQGYNLVDPPYVNTVAMPKSRWAAIRFTADNPGVRYVHCHLDRHITWGMDTAFIVKNGGTAKMSLRPPPAYMPPCEN